MAENNIFKELYKMFSMGTIISHRGKNKTNIMDLNARERQSSEMNDFEGYKSKLFYKGFVDQQTGRNFKFNKIELYKDYEEMDRDPIVSSALDLYSEESSVKNPYGEVLSIESDNQEVKDHLYELFYDRLDIEFNLAPWVRGLVKYGDHFIALDISAQDGVISHIPMSVYNVEKSLGSADNPFEISYRVANINKRFENYEMIHFTYIGDGNFAPYGRSLIENGRKVWKMLALMEDAMLIHRIIRSPEKRVFKIDVGNLPPNEVDNYMDRIVSQIRRTPYYDPQTGDYNLKYNMQNITEDFFFAVRGGENGTSIDTIGGLEYTAIDDIEYLKKKLLSSLRIPAPFLGFEEAVGCIVPSTKITLLNGEEKSIIELIDDFNNGIKNYVFAYDEELQTLVPGEITWAGFTKKDADLVRVTLSNSLFIDCTPDHKFLTNDNEWVEAKDLQKGQNIIPSNIIELTTDELIIDSVNYIDYKMDTCDITIDKYHNFVTSSGAIIHNSKATLAAEDLRFARTIEKIQRVMESELKRIAVIHLYVLGYKGEDLAEFKLRLTNPSIIYEQEKIALLDSKVALARNMQETKLFSDTWIYKNIFTISESEIDSERLSLMKEYGFKNKLRKIEENGIEEALSSNEEDETKNVDIDDNEKFEDGSLPNPDADTDDKPEHIELNTTGSKEIKNNGLKSKDKDKLGVKDYKKQFSLSKFLGVKESKEYDDLDRELDEIAPKGRKIYLPISEADINKLDLLIKSKKTLIK